MVLPSTKRPSIDFLGAQDFELDVPLEDRGFPQQNVTLSPKIALNPTLPNQINIPGTITSPPQAFLHNASPVRILPESPTENTMHPSHIKIKEKKVGKKGYAKEIKEVINALEKLGITNTRFDQTLMRGFDYYTGIVFEVFDKNPENRRSVFGGGRYDDLLSIFEGEKVSAFGFGAGDVVARDLLETYGNVIKQESILPADVYICLLNKDFAEYGQELAQSLREKNIKTSIDFSFRKIGDQIRNADKIHIPNVICIGEEEVKTGNFKLKNLATGEEKMFTVDTIEL